MEFIGFEKLLQFPIITLHTLLVLLALLIIVIFAYYTFTKRKWTVFIYRKQNLINFIIPNPYDTELSVQIYMEGNTCGYQLTCTKVGAQFGVEVIRKRTFPMYELKIQSKKEARMELIYEPHLESTGKDVEFLVKATNCDSGKDLQTYEATLRGSTRGWISVMGQKYYKSTQKAFLV